MADILNFTVLDAVYFCIPINVQFCSGVQLSYLERVWSFQFLLSLFLRHVWSCAQSGLWLSECPSLCPRIYEFSSLVSGNRHYSRSWLSSGTVPSVLPLLPPRLEVVSSQTCADQFSAEYSWDPLQISGLSVWAALSSLDSVLCTLPTLTSPESQLHLLNSRNPSDFAWVCSFCPMASKLSQGGELGQCRAHLIYTLSLRDYCLHWLRYRVLKTVVSYIFLLILLVFQKENKFRSCYSILARQGSNKPNFNNHYLVLRRSTKVSCGGHRYSAQISLSREDSLPAVVWPASSCHALQGYPQLCPSQSSPRAVAEQEDLQ